MSKSPNKILFITPTGGRTGSEMMLWYYLNIADRFVLLSRVESLGSVLEAAYPQNQLLGLITDG